MHRLPLTAFFIVLCFPFPLFAAGTIEANYRSTMEAYREQDWERAERLARITLQQIDSRNWKDWYYTGGRRTRMAYFTGDLVYMTTSEGQPWESNKVEIHDPLRNKLVRVYDFDPWLIFGSTHTPNYTVTFLRWSEYIGYKIVWFEKGSPENERTILRDSIEEVNATRKEDDDLIELYEKGPRGWVLSVFEPATGSFKEVHHFETIDISKSVSAQAHLIKDAEYWKFLDGNKLYGLNVGTWGKELLFTLPFEISPYDVFTNTRSEKLVAVRGDTLYIVTNAGDNDYEIRTIHLPYPLHVNHWTQRIASDDSGRWFAQTDTDSLRIFSLDGDSARLVRSASSCLGSTYLILPDRINTFWKGDTLVHHGDAGLELFKGARPIYDIDAGDLRTNYIKGLEYFLVYRAPGEFLALDMRDLQVEWTKTFTVTNLQVLAVLEDRYVLFDHIDGMSLLDIKTGEELLQVPRVGIFAADLNADGNRILLGGDDFIGVFEIPNQSKLRGDLIAVSGLSKWAAEDTSGALKDVRTALSSSMRLSSGLSEDLLQILTDLKLRKESLRLIGDMAIRTDDETWRKRLENEGMEFFIDPKISEYYAIFKLNEGVIAFPALIFAFGVAKGEDRTLYWFEEPHYRIERRALPVCGFSVTQEHLFFFEYKIDDSGENLIWSPLLFTESIDGINLGPLLTTKIEEDPENQRYIEYAIEVPSNSYTRDRALTEIRVRWGGIGGDQSEMFPKYTAGIDLTGNGANWYDSMLVDPVRIGNRFFAHRMWGNRVMMIAEGSQADSIGVEVGDIVVSFGGYPINNAMQVNIIKTFFPDRHPMEFTVIRNGGRLNFTVLNGRIGYESLPCNKLIEIDPATGEYLAEIDLPPGYGNEGLNSAGELLYSLKDTLMFFDPLMQKQKKIIIEAVAEHRRHWPVPAMDILIMYNRNTEEMVALDISKTADDADRVLWKETFDNVYRLFGASRYPYSDSEKDFPVLLRDGTLLLLDTATGSVIARETIPFRDFGLIPQIWNGILYGTAAGKIFGWKIDYYHPPFPWKYAGFGASAFVPLLLVSILLNRHRIEKLKARQAVELKRAEIDAEVSAARRLQAGLIPVGAHDLGAFQFVGKFIPASEVAGDYFDFRLLDDGRLVVVIGDVSGHGLPAGILVSMAKASLMTLNRNGDTDLTQTLDSLNEVVRNGSPEKSMFMTICYLIIDPERQKISCSANGHPFPLIARQDGSCSEIGVKGGYPLGIREKQIFQVVETDFQPGDTLLVYTDGLPEQVGPEGEPWGYDNFITTFCNNVGIADLEDLIDGIFQKALAYTGGGDETEDDMALVAIRYKSGQLRE
ncbi:MAG TPA: SpoIIE family protein phosphatase [Patescibacteria group bacterium]|nr:SpoIIE family protein phosphatase [Patescibacteria group bacterium]